MKKALKIILWSVVSLVGLLFVSGWIFMYKIKNGFPVSYETEAPAIEIPDGKHTVLLFSKSTGFRHESSIEAGKARFHLLAEKNNWFLYDTEDGGVFNPEQLSKFDAIIFNNSTGRVLNDEQQKVLEDYVNNGGNLIGIHGSGDNSHHWDWYEQNLMGARFSHHPLNPQLQLTDITLNPVPDSALMASLPAKWSHSDEWYVFLENPRAKGFSILYTIDGEAINPSGNMLWMKDMDFGMGKDHPVAWYKETGKGRTFYTSIGHDPSAWEKEAFVTMMEHAASREANH
jgi:type 1 glutamine amidotransferase